MRLGKSSEHLEQKSLFDWAQFAKAVHPELALMYAIPNGGMRNKAVAGQLKAEGVKSGVPDVCLPAARAEFHGLYVEMKFGKNQPSDNQRWWLDCLSQAGYFTAVCWSADDARRVILQYLRLTV